jgi:hypothetical protein
MADDEAEMNDEEKAAYEKAGRANAELIARVGQKPDDPVTPLSLRKNGEGTVLVTVPRQFFYRPDHRKLVVVRPGVQEIPHHLAENKWFLANGVTRVDLAEAAINKALALAPAPQAPYALGEPVQGTEVAAKKTNGKRGAN